MGRVKTTVGDPIALATQNLGNCVQ
jgi:hypothetical protein